MLFVRVIFFMCWHILWKNALYLYLDSSTWSIEYHEVCLLATTSCIIEDMKIAQRNKWGKLKIVNLDTSSTQGFYQELMKNPDTFRYIELRGSRIFRFVFRPMMTWTSRVSFTKLLGNIKGSFWSHHSTQRLN